MTKLLNHVSILQGTDSSHTYSHGNTLPLCATPFGMTHWTMETTQDPRFFFAPRSKTFHGIRATHQPSPWIGDYGAIRILPQTGEKLTGRAARYSCFHPDKMLAAPHVLDLVCLRYQTRIQVSPTARCGWLKFTFPAATPKRIILDFLCEDFSLRPDPDRRGLSGHTRQHSGGVPASFALYAAFRLDIPFQRIGEAEEGLYLELPPDATTLNLRVGTSFIGVDQARCNLERETGHREYEQIRAQARDEWERRLGAFRLEGDSASKTTFYSCLYRTLLFPRVFHESSEQGKQVHYSPYDGQVHEGPLVADNGFWDTHRTVYPLFSLVLGDEYDEMLQGWTNAAREGGGWFPRWSSPGYRACMIGTHADAVIADAVVKGRTGFDVESAYRALRNDAYTPGHPEELYGRVGLREYIDLGYLPSEHYAHAVSRTLDYAYNDFCIAQVADRLGDPRTRDDLLQRSRNYRHVFNPQTGFMQGRDRQGNWRPDFSPIRWGGDYVEGAAWQCGWAVPHDVEGLMALHGGRAAFLKRLESVLHTAPAFEVGAYRCEIHEMTEMALADFGQYAHSNQPVHHLLWMWSAAGGREKAAPWISRVVREMYGPGIDGFPGDEDNGEMAAWYVFAIMGMYPLCPGKPEYVRATPHCEKLEVTLGNGAMLEINPNSDTGFRTPARVSHAEVMRGGVL